MINGTLEQFLDTGWFSEATIFYKGYTYWFEGAYDDNAEKPFHFWIDRYKSEVVDGIYTRRVPEEGGTVMGEYILDIFAENEEAAKKIMLEAKIFDGKTFWEAENELAWYDEI